MWELSMDICPQLRNSEVCWLNLVSKLQSSLVDYIVRSDLGWLAFCSLTILTSAQHRKAKRYRLMFCQDRGEIRSTQLDLFQLQPADMFTPARARTCGGHNYLSIYLSIYINLSISMDRSTYRSIDLSIYRYQSFDLSIIRYRSIGIDLSINLLYLSSYAFLSLSVSLSLSLILILILIFIYLSILIYFFYLYLFFYFYLSLSMFIYLYLSLSVCIYLYLSFIYLLCSTLL